MVPRHITFIIKKLIYKKSFIIDVVKIY